MTIKSQFANKKPPVRATSKEWLGLAVIALPCMLYSMDFTVLNLAVPALVRDLHPSSSQLLWIMDVYGFFLGGALITMGALGDRIGRRRLLLIGAVLFGLGSLLAAFAGSTPILILARALLGVAAATLAPSTLSLIRNMFHDGRQRTLAMGIWIASFSVGAAIGPILGGILLSYFWWGSVFLIAIPVMLLLLVTGPLLLPEYRDPHPGRIDPISVSLSMGAILPVIYGIKRLAENGFFWPYAAVIGLGLFIGWLFVKRQRHLQSPLIDLTLFRSPSFVAALGINVLSFFINFPAFLYIAQYLQLGLGQGPLLAGLWMVPSGVGFVAGSLITPRLVRRFQSKPVVATGFMVVAIGFSLLGVALWLHSLVLLACGFALYSLGLAPVITLAVNFIVGAAPPERAGAAAGIGQTGTEIGGALGVALLGSLGTLIYRHEFHDKLSPAIKSQLPEQALSNLGGTVEASKHLPASLGVELASSARIAFVHSMEIVVYISAAMALFAALIVFGWLWRARARKSSL